jgi:surfactin synthase thioesterase subunit
VAIKHQVGQEAHLLCIPQAGAGPSAYKPLGEQLASDCSTWAACLPGRDRRAFESPLTSIESMADELVSPAAGLNARTLIIYGHCSGALVGYELAHRIAASATRKLALVVGAQPAPAKAATAGRPSDLISDADADRMIADLGGTDPEVLRSSEMMALLRPAIKADMRAVEAYSPERWRAGLSVPVTGICGSRDQVVPASEMSEWCHVTEGQFELLQLDSDHFFAQSDPVSLAAALRKLLNQLRVSAGICADESAGGQGSRVG